MGDGSGSLGVIEEFFGAQLGCALGEVHVDDVIGLPPLQMAELLYRIVSANKMAYQTLYESSDQSRSALILPGGPRAWDHTASVNHIKSAIMYIERPVIPDPLWEAVEEIVSFFAIAHGWDARHGLLEAFEWIDEIRLTGEDQPFYTANQRGRWVYPAEALIQRIARIEEAGNDARQLLAVALRRAIELAPVLRADPDISLRPYPDSRMGGSHTPKHIFDSQRLFASRVYSSVMSRALPSADMEDEKWEYLVDRSDIHSPELRALASTNAALGKRQDLLKHLAAALTQQGVQCSPNWEEIIIDLAPSGMQIFVSEPQDINFLADLSALLERRAPRPDELACWSNLPGVNDATFKDLAALRSSAETFDVVRRAISRIMNASFADNLPPELARRRIAEAATQELRPEIDRLLRESKRSATLPNLMAGAAGIGVGLMSIAAGEPLAGLVGAAAAQVPWVTEIATPLSRNRTPDVLLKVYGLLQSGRDDLSGGQHGS